jgi:hypothetical protein
LVFGDPSAQVVASRPAGRRNQGVRKDWLPKAEAHRRRKVATIKGEGHVMFYGIMRNVISSSLAMLGVGLAAPVIAAELVTNGGFESSQYTNSLVLFGVNTPATNWTSTGNWVMFCSGSGIRCDDSKTGGYLTPPVPLSPQGGNFMGLDGTSGFDGSIYQTINGLVVGETLTLSFYMATAQECCATDPTTDTVTVTLGDQSYTTPKISTPGGGTTPWALYTNSFTYDGVGNILTFVNAGEGTPPYALIDGVSLTSGGMPGTPEASTWVMIVAGFAGMAFCARVRRRTIARAA